MSKTVADKILEGLNEALAIAKGEAEPAAVHHVAVEAKPLDLDRSTTRRSAGKKVPTMSEPKFGEWQPIETAPKDGRHVLVLCGWPSLAWMFVCCWSGRGERWETDPGEWPRNPTHWMPLPEPPDPDHE